MTSKIGQFLVKIAFLTKQILLHKRPAKAEKF